MDHRRHIGGKWDEIGKLQFDWMVSNGLKPEHKLIDYGCGSGRGAVHFIEYLNGGGYLGLDQDQKMLDAATSIECRGLMHKLPAFLHVDHMPCSVQIYDYAIAQSVFTHCNVTQISRIMSHIQMLLKPDGVFYATCFEGPHNLGNIRQMPGGRTTHPDRDPYHYPQEFWQHSKIFDGWNVEWIGDWDHPRNQKMLRITREAS